MRLHDCGEASLPACEARSTVLGGLERAPGGALAALGLLKTARPPPHATPALGANQRSAAGSAATRRRTEQTMVEFLRTRLLRASARQPLGRSCPARRIFTAVQDHAHTLPLVEVWKFLLMTVVVAYVSGPYTCTWNLHLKRPQSSQRIVGGAGQPGMHATYAYLVRPPSKAVSRCSLLLRSQARDSAGVRMRVGSAIGDTLGSRSSNKGCARPPSADEHPTPQVTMEKATKRYRLVVDRQADVEHYVA